MVILHYTDMDIHSSITIIKFVHVIAKMHPISNLTFKAT